MSERIFTAHYVKDDGSSVYKEVVDSTIQGAFRKAQKIAEAQGWALCEIDSNS